MPMRQKHPYGAHEGTAPAIAKLEKNRDVTITTTRQYVIGYLCQEVSRRASKPSGKD
jgi:hypothetical protein